MHLLGGEDLISQQIQDASELADESVKTLLDGSFSELNSSIATVEKTGLVKTCNLTRANVDRLRCELEDTLDYVQQFNSTRNQGQALTEADH